MSASPRLANQLRMTYPVFFRQYELPWTPAEEGEQRYRRILRNVLVLVLLVGLAMPFLPVLERKPSQAPELPERVVQLIVEQPKPPPPPPPPRVEPKPEVKVVRVEPKPVDRAAEARKKAEQSGLLALKDELADLRDENLTANVANTRPLTGAVTDTGQVERSLITSKVGRSSGGINTASMSRNIGGVALAARGSTQVTSAVAGLGVGGPSVSKGGTGMPSRSREEIEMVFDQNKGAIYALYSRALRRDPSLQGKLVLKLTIEPSGVVSSCEVVSSEIKDAELLDKLVQRVKMFRFLAKDVATITTTKPIDFFPA
jgi:outer membrane biosynthesis protein TonB